MTDGRLRVPAFIERAGGGYVAIHSASDEDLRRTIAEHEATAAAHEHAAEHADEAARLREYLSRLEAVPSIEITGADNMWTVEATGDYGRRVSASGGRCSAYSR